MLRGRVSRCVCLCLHALASWLCTAVSNPLVRAAIETLLFLSKSGCKCSRKRLEFLHPLSNRIFQIDSILTCCGIWHLVLHYVTATLNPTQTMYIMCCSTWPRALTHPWTIVTDHCLCLCHMARTIGIFPGWTGYFLRENQIFHEGEIQIDHRSHKSWMNAVSVQMVEVETYCQAKQLPLPPSPTTCLLFLTWKLVSSLHSWP